MRLYNAVLQRCAHPPIAARTLAMHVRALHTALRVAIRITWVRWGEGKDPLTHLERGNGSPLQPRAICTWFDVIKDRGSPGVSAEVGGLGEAGVTVRVRGPPLLTSHPYFTEASKGKTVTCE